ncbi:amyloid fiber anchoring/assembly protein TapA [Fictibacillus sp. UD]|uniref:amyloid fiber anchoring/assembly protein TapA n=1 Tax=Fictibacillus sp. UD TaxID=3038777 RepID=UPI003746C2C6
MKRLRKFRDKNWVYVFSLKIGLIFYTFAFSILYLTGNTAAYFNDTKNVNGEIKVGIWWDQSSLSFIAKQQTVNKGQCIPVVTTIKNGGDRDMQGSVNYEVWWAEKGNPKDGMKISGGEVKALKTGESFNLSYSSNKNGNYKFKAYQRTGHPGQGELWSDEINLNCTDSKAVEEAKENKNSPEKVEEVNKTPEQEQQQQIEPVTPETAPEATEQAPSSQTSEVKEEENPENTTTTDPNTQETSNTPITEVTETTSNPQPIEQNETQKDDLE